MPHVLTGVIRRKLAVLLAAGCAGLVLVLAATGLYWYVYENAANADNQAFSTLTTENNQVTTNFDQMAASWIRYASTTPSRNHRYSAYINAATLYLSNNQNAQAIAMCQKAERVSGVTFAEAEIAANAYFSLSDKKQAIHYYQEAIRLIPSSVSDKSAEIASFNQAIEELETKS